MHNILLHSQAFVHSKTDVQLRICTLFRLTVSLRASSPFGRYLEKETRESLSRLHPARSRVLAGLASLAEIREFVCRLTHRLFFVLYAISTLNFTRNGFNKESCATSVGYTIFWFTILRFCNTETDFLQFYDSAIKKICIKDNYLIYDFFDSTILQL